MTERMWRLAVIMAVATNYWGTGTLVWYDVVERRWREADISGSLFILACFGGP